MMPDQVVPCPYGDLHIYYIKGRIEPQKLPYHEAFLGNWEEEEDSFLFFKQPADEIVHELIRQHPQAVLQDTFCMPYEQWQGGAAWPLQVGRLCVVPPWHPQAHTLRDSILLDPGVVFGTGSHPTTRDCLAAMQLAFDRQPVDRVLDLGTGTGLLALAAARLGARRVLAVDLNRLAAQTAYRNVLANRLYPWILVVQGDAKNFMDLPFDLMVSNIHYAVMRQLVREPGFRRHKQFVLSGLLRSQALEIEYLLRAGRAKILRKWEQEGTWYTFYGHNG